jgi:hypothetical protein
MQNVLSPPAVGGGIPFLATEPSSKTDRGDSPSGLSFNAYLKKRLKDEPPEKDDPPEKKDPVENPSPPPYSAMPPQEKRPEDTQACAQSGTSSTETASPEGMQATGGIGSSQGEAAQQVEAIKIMLGLEGEPAVNGEFLLPAIFSSGQAGAEEALQGDAFEHNPPGGSAAEVDTKALSGVKLIQSQPDVPLTKEAAGGAKMASALNEPARITEAPGKAQEPEARATSRTSGTNEPSRDGIIFQPVEGRPVIMEAVGSTAKVLTSAAVPTGEINGLEVARQVAQKVCDMAESGKASLRLQLYPEKLGRIDLHLVSGVDGLQVTITAGQALTGQLLEGHLEDLREALSRAGVQVNGLQVGVGQDQRPAGHSDQGRRRLFSGTRNIHTISVVPAEVEMESWRGRYCSTQVDYHV